MICQSPAFLFTLESAALNISVDISIPSCLPVLDVFLSNAKMNQQRVTIISNAIFILVAILSIPYVESNIGSNPWQATEISPVVLYQIENFSRRIEIRDDLRNRDQADNKRKTYYVTPLGELDPFSASARWNNISKEFEVRFAVQMWDDELIQTAWEYLKAHEEPLLPRSRVKLLPIQSVALRCYGCKGFGINGSPLRVATLPKRVHFSLTCDTAEEGDRLVALMKSEPEHFQILRLAFDLQGQPLENKVIAIHLDATLNGDLYTQIKQQLPGKTKAFLLPADEEHLKRQFVQDLQAKYMWKSPDIQENYAQELLVGVHHFLVDSRHDSTNFDTTLWQFLFWRNKDGLLRPDLIAEKLSTLSKNYDTSLVQNWFQDTPSTTSYTEETQQSAEKEITEYLKVENVTEFVAKAREFVRWNGTSFVPKPLRLTEINLFERIDATNNGKFQVTVQFSPAALLRTVTIRDEDTHQEQTATKKQIAALTEFLKTNFTKEIEQLKVRMTENEKKKVTPISGRAKDLEELSASERNVSAGTSEAQDQQALTYLASLVAHFHSKAYTVNQPVWYSSVRTNPNDLINNLSRYGLVSYLPPEKSLWLACARESQTDVSLRNFWTKTKQNEGTLTTTSINTPVVWDPIKSKLLYFNGKNLQEFPKEKSRHDSDMDLDRTISTDAPWRHVLDMSFDWITRNLYILSSNNYFIFVLSIANPYSWTQLKCSQTQGAIERLVVDPLGGYLFWSTNSSVIRRSWLNGDNVTTIWDPEASYTISPWSLTIDHDTGSLYVVDSSQKTIVALDRDGNIQKTIPLRWANGEEAELFETSKNLNKVPNGFVVIQASGVFFIDLKLEIVHPVEDVVVEPASRYAVFSSSLQSYPFSVNPCSRNGTDVCIRNIQHQRQGYYHHYHSVYQQTECVEYGYTETPCGDKVCLHNPHGEHACY